MHPVRIGLIQLSCTADKDYNIARTIDSMKIAVEKGAQIICLQELFATPYFCHTEDHKYFDLAEPLNGPTVKKMQDFAKINEVVIVVPIFEQRARGLFHNSAVVIDADGTILGYYRKNHIPDDPGFYEKFYFTPADTGYRVFRTRYGTIGVLICWDQWFPEAARIVSLMGAEIIFYPTAIGWELESNEKINIEQYNAWQLIQRAHAVANGVYVVAVNRVGTEPVTKFWGGSFVANPFGSILFQAPHDEEIVNVLEIDLDQIQYYRTIWPFLRDRRIETYQPILKRYIDDERNS
ncbi:MAG: carbon-nitrogen hydrolase [Bacteroidales bacterium]|nr:carbon-nitrogen hydrolase [Bacteroidales bacterium]